MNNHKLIESIQRYLADSAMSEDASGLASAYADACSKANQRLGVCANYIKQGMISESLRLADNEPPLLELCAQLDFVGVENWSALCRSRRWAVAEPLDTATLSELNEAFSSSALVEPLLKEYRLVVRAGKTRDCIRILRHLVGIHKDDPNWRSDLIAFEKKRWGELRAEFNRRKSSAGLAELLELRAEMDGDWIAPRDESLIVEVQAFVDRFSADKAVAEAFAIVEDLSAAYAALDCDRVGDALQRYEGLRGEALFQLPARIELQVKEAAEWFRAEQKHRDERSAWESAVQQLRDAVESGSSEKIVELLNLLARHDRPVPDRLEERAKSLLEDHHQYQARRRTMTIVFASVVGLLVIVAGAMYVYDQRIKALAAGVATQLEAYWKEENLDGFVAVIDRYEVDQPRVLARPEVAAWVVRETELQQRVVEKNRRFDALMQELASLEAGGFSADRMEIETRVREAAGIAVTADRRSSINRLSMAWEAHKIRIQAEIDGRAEEAAARLETSFAGITGSHGLLSEKLSAELAPFKSALIEQNASYSNASPMIYDRFVALDRKALQLAADIDEAKGQNEVVRRANGLNSYLDAAETFAAAFSGDLTGQQFKRIVDLRNKYEALVKRNAEQDATSLRSADIAFLKQMQDREQSSWDAISTIIINLEDIAELDDVWSGESEDGSTILYFKGMPSYQGCSIDTNKCVAHGSWKGEVYRHIRGSFAPIFNRDDAIRSSVKIDCGGASGICGIVRMAHCDFIDSIARVAESFEPVRLTTKFRALQSNPDISPLLKVYLFNMINPHYEAMVDLNAFPDWVAFRRDLERVYPNGVHWMCVKNPDVISANRDAAGVLKKWFDDRQFFEQMDLSYALADLSVSRSIECVGFVDVLTGEKVPFGSRALPGELWVLRSDAEGTRLLIAEEVIKGQNRVYVNYEQGELLFAPADGKSTRELLVAQARDARVKSLEGLRWPGAWPQNLR